MRLSFFQRKFKIYFKEMSMYNLFYQNLRSRAMKNITIIVVEKETIFRVEKFML